MAKSKKVDLSKLLALAIYLASKGHLNQMDKGGNPYILHPLRLMNQFTDVELKIIAILHDYIEDTDATLDDLIEYGFTTRVVLALDALTHRKGESYYDYVLRIAANADATAIKKADLKDNSDITRLKNPKLTEVDVLRMEKYANTYQFLSGRMSIEEYRDVMARIRADDKAARARMKEQAAVDNNDTNNTDNNTD